MNHHLPKGVLTAAIIAMRMACTGQQVYSQGGSSFGRLVATEAAHTNNNGIAADSCIPAIPYGDDEVCITTQNITSVTNTTFMAWIVSTNLLAKQPRWDGNLDNIPLNITNAYNIVLPQVRRRFPAIPTWAVQSILLRKPAADLFPDVWCYEIIFVEQADFSARRAILLLDGTMVSPRSYQY